MKRVKGQQTIDNVGKQLGIIFSVGADVYRLNVCVLEASTFSFEKRIDIKSKRIEGTMVGINRENQILNNFF